MVGVEEKRNFEVGAYRVVEEKKGMVCVYLFENYTDKKVFLTSRRNWNSAVKQAKLLDQAYKLGYKHCGLDSDMSEYPYT
jgi:hypothetical protein